MKARENFEYYPSIKYDDTNERLFRRIETSSLAGVRKSVFWNGFELNLKSVGKFNQNIPPGTDESIMRELKQRRVKLSFELVYECCKYHAYENIMELADLWSQIRVEKQGCLQVKKLLFRVRFYSCNRNHKVYLYYIEQN